MPELPEVETTRRGIEPHIVDQKIERILVRQRQLRWPVPANINQKLKGQRITAVRRRGKYLLIDVAGGSVLWHLGMSGSLRIVSASTPVEKHDHVDLLLKDGQCLRFNDPRRFGAVLWSARPEQHKLIKNLGPEPLDDVFDAEYLFQRSRKRKQAVKLLIMDAGVVVGVGNIYANEALFIAGIRPGKAAGRVTRHQYELLVDAIKTVLARAIESGGTTLKDFVGGDGKPGYFQQQLNVYGRGGESCIKCKSLLTESRMGQRATVYCRVCQV